MDLRKVLLEFKLFDSFGHFNESLDGSLVVPGVWQGYMQGLLYERTFER